MCEERPARSLTTPLPAARGTRTIIIYKENGQTGRANSIEPRAAGARLRYAVRDRVNARLSITHWRQGVIQAGGRFPTRATWVKAVPPAPPCSPWAVPRLTYTPDMDAASSIASLKQPSESTFGATHALHSCVHSCASCSCFWLRAVPHSATSVATYPDPSHILAYRARVRKKGGSLTS